MQLWRSGHPVAVIKRSRNCRVGIRWLHLLLSILSPLHLNSIPNSPTMINISWRILILTRFVRRNSIDRVDTWRIYSTLVDSSWWIVATCIVASIVTTYWVLFSIIIWWWSCTCIVRTTVWNILGCQLFPWIVDISSWWSFISYHSRGVVAC
jgi:hypothetical protein